MYKFIVTLVTRPANSLYLGSLALSQKKVQEPKKRKKEEKRGKRERKEKREKKKANRGRKK